jgi:hypothetical protein
MRTYADMQGNFHVSCSDMSQRFISALNTHIHTYIRAYIQRYIYTYIHTCIHTYIHNIPKNEMNIPAGGVPVRLFDHRVRVRAFDRDLSKAFPRHDSVGCGFCK